MNLFQLEYFLTLADTLNYTKASKMLHITQPNLSKMIVNLEQEVGAQLFLRSKRDVCLTPAGAMFYDEISEMMRSYRAALEKTHNVQSGVTGMIDIGFLGTATQNILPDIVNRCRRENPQIALHLKDFTFSPLAEAIASNEIDLAILPDRELDMPPNMSKKYLFSDSMCAVLPENHPLANEEKIDLGALKDTPFVMMNQKVSIRDHDLVTNMCLEQGFLPRVSYEANSILNLLVMVACEVGVAILASHVADFSTNGVKFVKLVGYEHFFRMVCIWKKDRNPCIENFIEVVDKVIGNKEDPQEQERAEE